MSHLDELKAETRDIITDLLNDGSDPDALYIIEHHISHHDFDKLEKIAMEAFKAGYEVSEPEIIDAQQKELLPLLEKYKGNYDGWGTYFEDPNAKEDEYGDDGEFFDDEDDLDDDEEAFMKH